MCGRYNIHDDPWLQTLLRELGIEARLATRVNIAPTEMVPVVFEENGSRRLHDMRWWLVPAWAPRIDTRYSMFNAKVETLQSSRAFRGPLRHRRCIVPASSFIEWNEQDGKRQPWLLRPQAGAIAFAGLWDLWEKEGSHLESCTVITTEASGGIQRLHHRMPLMLDASVYDAWLDPASKADAVRAALASRARAPLVLAPLSRAVNNSRNKTEDLLAPTAAEEIIDEDVQG